MKIGIVGYRHFNDMSLFSEKISALGTITEIVSGGCVGTDTLAKIYADKRGIKMTVFMPKGYQRHHYLDRNTEIVESGIALLVAFLSKDSKGTYDTINKANSRGIKVLIIDI